MKLLLPVLLAVIGLVGGAAAGWFLKPAPPPEPEVCLDAGGAALPPEACPKPEAAADEAAQGEPTPEAEGSQGEPTPEAEGDPTDKSEFVKLERQFIVPVMADQKVAAMAIVGLSVEVAPGHVEDVLSREPRVRDALLRVLFDHAYSGGFNGDFTAEYVLRDLRRNLLTATRKVAGPNVRDVLVEEIMRQDQ